MELLPHSQPPPHQNMQKMPQEQLMGIFFFNSLNQGRNLSLWISAPPPAPHMPLFLCPSFQLIWGQGELQSCSSCTAWGTGLSKGQQRWWTSFLSLRLAGEHPEEPVRKKEISHLCPCFCHCPWSRSSPDPRSAKDTSSGMRGVKGREGNEHRGGIRGRGIFTCLRDLKVSSYCSHGMVQKGEEQPHHCTLSGSALSLPDCALVCWEKVRVVTAYRPFFLY